ncbi:hypothetical protein [Merismopedia glauca]|uniref:Uncharacterized protein n=1 Tax=Merismopedia glauca CCAP 1448/3 TaxID=1296344 RepID=A0A2T1C509_9CYAN|nr:hypothetical protein [Merismopedia glauca]PSB03227.1 hypothetical protein C7B64_09405 [Merismopedia glauca CCAP 1448/3]
MTISHSFLRSVVLSIFLSFIAPILLTITIFISLLIVGCFPGVTALTLTSTNHIKQFLAVFGNGCPLQGLLVISITCSLVGALFDTYAFYRYQTMRGN